MKNSVINFILPKRLILFKCGFPRFFLNQYSHDFLSTIFCAAGNAKSQQSPKYAQKCQTSKQNKHKHALQELIGIFFENIAFTLYNSPGVQDCMGISEGGGGAPFQN